MHGSPVASVPRHSAEADQRQQEAQEAAEAGSQMHAAVVQEVRQTLLEQ